VEGVSASGSLVHDVPAHWPQLKLAVRVDPGPGPEHDAMVDGGAVIRMRSGGWVHVERETGLATFSLPTEPTPAALVHPHLAAAVTVSAYWLGRESFHAGAFVVGDGAWAVVGEKTSGKSTLLASIAQAGLPVMTDDILVLAGETALAGPRSIDLRQPTAEHLGIGEALGVFGDRERWRVPLPQVEPELPLRGWVSLRWAEETVVRPVKGSERLMRIAGNRGFLLEPRDPAMLIGLSSLPMLELSRPARWDAAADALERLLSACRQSQAS
jgi:hypothetical protein